MSWYVDLPTQVRRVLPRRSGGTGNRHGWGTGVVVAAVNRGADTIPIGSAVRVVTPDGVVMVDDPAATDVHGVSVGRFESDGTTFVAEGAEPNEVVAVMVAGAPKVRVDDAAVGTVLIGAWVIPTAEPGAVDASATPTAEAFGRFTMGGQAGDLVSMRLGGGGGSAGGPALDDGSLDVTFPRAHAGQAFLARVPWDAAIVGWAIAGEQAGDAVVDVWYTDEAGLPTIGSGESIVASDPPTLAADQVATGSAVGWGATITKGDWIVMHVDSLAIIGTLTVVLICERTS